MEKKKRKEKNVPTFIPVNKIGESRQPARQKKYSIFLHDTVSSCSWSLDAKASATYLASEHQRQRVVRAGNFAMAQQWSALGAFHYRRHS